MAVTHYYVDFNTSNTSQQTFSLGSDSYTSGRRICVVGTAERNNHTAGLDSNFSISDDASTNTITWTAQHTSAIWDNGNFDAQLKVWTSSELTDNETFDITIDGNSAGTEQFRYRLQVIEFDGGDGTFELADSDANDSGTDPACDLGSAPDKNQLLIAFRYGGGGNTWDANPTNFTDFTASSDSNTAAMESSTNTDQTVSYGGSTTFVIFLFHGQLAEAAAAGGGILRPAMTTATRHLLTR